MRRLSLYILRQIVGPFVLFTALMTAVVWLTQSLRLLDLVINQGASAGIFAYLSLLALPSLLAIIVPIAFFGAAVYALHRLNNDSEMVVMWSAGVSRAQMAIPVMIAAFVAVLITYACSLYLMPAGQRAMRDKVFDIRADIGAAILKEGAFTAPTDGLTVFIRELQAGGEVRGILVHDSRNALRPVSYLAESGVLVQTAEGARLVMINGTVQQSDRAGARLSVLSFDRYVFDLDQFAGPQRSTELETSERYLGELLRPVLQGPDQDARRTLYVAEAHARLSSALYCFAFALMALGATATAHLARTSFAMRLAGTAIAATALRMGGYAAQGAAAENPMFVPALYLLPLIGAVAAGLVLAQVPLVPARLKALFQPAARESRP